jgi:UDP-N-acetylglucosamine--N-acetylmuramyl-(pentapeptide) pyrophosphoryl-undecaprenol N-acetylglucosamine transferase
MLGIDFRVRLILGLGESQGAKILTNWAAENYEKFGAHGVCIYCLSGSRAPKNFEINGNKFVAFRDAMNPLYNAADIIVLRAGSGTISESMKCQKKMVLVPYRHAADGHQFANARYAEKLGYAVCVEEFEIDTRFEKVMEVLKFDG